MTSERRGPSLKQLCESNPAAREFVERASQGPPLSAVMHPEAVEWGYRLALLACAAEADRRAGFCGVKSHESTLEYRAFADLAAWARKEAGE